MSFSESDYQSAADKLGVSIAAVKAVAEVESSGQTMWIIGGQAKPPIRLEAHWFGRFTGYRHNDSHPHISAREWTPSLAATTHEGAWRQFWEADALDHTAAIQATSWGPFQIMGFHWQAMGYGSPDEFVTAMSTPAGQLDGFVRFIKASVDVHDALRRQDWHNFAARYNGPGQVDTYSKRIADAFARHSGDAPPDTLTCDEAIRRFQAKHGLAVDGVVGPITRAALGI